MTTPKLILISYLLQDETVQYYAVPYNERLLALNNLYVNVDHIDEDLITLLENLHPDERIEPSDLRLYSHLITTGWM